jgi:hypothetical protein
MQESDEAVYYTLHPPKAQSPMNAQVTTTAYFLLKAVWRAAMPWIPRHKRTEGANWVPWWHLSESLRYQGQGERQ